MNNVQLSFIHEGKQYVTIFGATDYLKNQADYSNAISTLKLVSSGGLQSAFKKLCGMPIREVPCVDADSVSIEDNSFVVHGIVTLANGVHEVNIDSTGIHPVGTTQESVTVDQVEESDEVAQPENSSTEVEEDSSYVTEVQARKDEKVSSTEIDSPSEPSFTTENVAQEYVEKSTATVESKVVNQDVINESKEESEFIKSSVLDNRENDEEPPAYMVHTRRETPYKSHDALKKLFAELPSGNGFAMDNPTSESMPEFHIGGRTRPASGFYIPRESSIVLGRKYTPIESTSEVQASKVKTAAEDVKRVSASQDVSGLVNPSVISTIEKERDASKRAENNSKIQSMGFKENFPSTLSLEGADKSMQSFLTSGLVVDHVKEEETVTHGSSNKVEEIYNVDRRDGSELSQPRESDNNTIFSQVVPDNVAKSMKNFTNVDSLNISSAPDMENEPPRVTIEELAAELDEKTVEALTMIPRELLGPLAEFSAHPVDEEMLLEKGSIYCIDHRWHLEKGWYAVDVPSIASRHFFNQSKNKFSISIPVSVCKDWLNALE